MIKPSEIEAIGFKRNIFNEYLFYPNENNRFLLIEETPFLFTLESTSKNDAPFGVLKFYLFKDMIAENIDELLIYMNNNCHLEVYFTEGLLKNPK